jgi:hypothetical protein
MSDLTTFNVSDVIQKIADSEGLNVEIDGIDDVCYGCVISTDKSFVDFCSSHRGPYNFQIVDGDPIRIVRRAIGDSLAIDFSINETACIQREGSPAVQFNRVDVATLPRQVEIQYMDPARNYGFTTQYARHPGAPTSNTTQSVVLDFVISADQARTMAFDYLYQMWSRQLSATFEHRDLRIEPGDTVQLTTDQGIFTLLIIESTITKGRTNQLVGTVLLTESLVSDGITITGGTADAYVQNNAAADYAAWVVAA